MTARYAHELPFGATLRGDGGTRFRLWAPSEEAVTLHVEGRDAAPMQPVGGGWFALDLPCGAGTRYQFGVGDLKVPDPASRFQPDDVHGPSLVVDPRAYAWRCTDWRGRPWHEAVIYELHVGALGGYRGVEAQLPYLADLGVTAIELMPIAEFPGGRNWGYDGVLPYAPESAYGSPEELKSCIDRAHELGLTVFLDVVYNHFGPDGNYLPVYAKEFFRADEHTPWGNAIDFRRPEVSDFFIQNALYWLLEYRFDGLRFDAVHAIGDEDWLIELARQIRAGVEPGRHVHLVLENEHNSARLLSAGFDAQWNDDSHHVAHVLLTGEHESYYADFAEDTAGMMARFLAEGFVYQGETSPRGKSRGEPSANLPPTAFVTFLQNHDQIGNRAFGERIAALSDRQALQAAKALYYVIPQIPMLFMGEECDSTTPFLFFTSHSDELADAVREGRRKEFASFAAFSDAERRERIPDPNSPKTFEASIPEICRGEDAALAFTKRLLGLRKRLMPGFEGAVSLGAEKLSASAVLARWRLGDGRTLVGVSNLGAEPVEAGVPITGEVLVETPAGAAEQVRSGRLPGATTVIFLESNT